MRSNFWIIIVIIFVFNFIARAKAMGKKKGSIWNMPRTDKNNAPHIGNSAKQRKIVNVQQTTTNEPAKHVYETEFDEDIARATLQKARRRAQSNDPSWIKDEDTWIKGE